MDENVDAALRLGALQLALVTAAIHLWLGWKRWAVYILAGTPFVDPLQVLFVLSALGVFVGVAMAARGVRLDYVYVLGIALMLSYLVGWLLLGGDRTGSSLLAPAWETAGHAHGSALVTLIEHLFEDWLLAVSKVVEATCLVILVVLLYGERTRDDAATQGDTADRNDAANQGGAAGRDEEADADDAVMES